MKMLAGYSEMCVFKFALPCQQNGCYLLTLLLLGLIPRDDLGVVFRVMVLLSMGHERPVGWPEPVALCRYLCKRKQEIERFIYFQMHRYRWAF